MCPPSQADEAWQPERRDDELDLIVPQLWKRPKKALRELVPHGASSPSRWEVLVRDYDMLRQDERSFVTVMVALSSLIALVMGTSVFFLLRSCAVGHTDGCHSYPAVVYILLPSPTLAGCALLVQQATTATIRGRIMLALEEALVAEQRQTFALGGGEAPAFSSRHMQHPLVHGPRGSVLWTLMLAVPFAGTAAMIYYCGTEFHQLWKWAFYGAYIVLLGVLTWGGSPTLRGFSNTGVWTVKHLERQRARGKFHL